VSAWLVLLVLAVAGVAFIIAFAAFWDLLDFLFVPKHERIHALAELVEAFKQARK